MENTAPRARTVLFWVQLYGEEPDVFAKCPELQCAVSYNQSDLAVADAVVFPEVSGSMSANKEYSSNESFRYGA